MKEKREQYYKQLHSGVFWSLYPNLSGNWYYDKDRYLQNKNTGKPNKIVTIDFDKTLTRKDVQEFVRYLIDSGIHCIVLTYRYDDANYHLYGGLYGDNGNDDLWEVVTDLGLKNNVIFTNCEPKSVFLNSINDVILHLDDDFRVMYDLRYNCKTLPIQVNTSSYQKKIKKLLNLI